MRHMVADVIFEEFAHQAIDRPARGGKALEDVGALFVIIQAPQHAFELPDDLFSPSY